MLVLSKLCKHKPCYTLATGRNKTTKTFMRIWLCILESKCTSHCCIFSIF